LLYGATPYGDSRRLPNQEARDRKSSYAVLFRTHFWDAFTQRQLERLREQVAFGTIYILVDETNGRVDGIAHDNIIRITEQSVLDTGLARAGSGRLLWFNGDYPLYSFLDQHDTYDIYVQLEYDVVLNTSVDDLVDRMRRDRVDFIGLTKGEPVREWAWLDTCTESYDALEIRYKLICLSLFSRPALQMLARRRREMSAAFQRGEISAWPFCEGFIATEIERANFTGAELSGYVDTFSYDTWPPFVESDLPVLAGSSVIHPVLDQKRYVSSLFNYKVGLSGYLNLNSVLHRKLRRLPAGLYMRTLLTSFIAKALRKTWALRTNLQFSS
jgi:hypothetical protein